MRESVSLYLGQLVRTDGTRPRTSGPRLASPLSVVELSARRVPEHAGPRLQLSVRKGSQLVRARRVGFGWCFAH